MFSVYILDSSKLRNIAEFAVASLLGLVVAAIITYMRRERIRAAVSTNTPADIAKKIQEEKLRYAPYYLLFGVTGAFIVSLGLISVSESVMTLFFALVGFFLTYFSLAALYYSRN